MLQPVNNKSLHEFAWSINGLSKKSIEKIHESALDLLQNTGIKVEDNPRALEIFNSGGCQVEEHKEYGIVKIPSAVVEKCLDDTPRNVTVYGRGDDSGYTFKDNHITFTPFGEQIQIIDPETREIRKTTQQDVADITRLCDHFDQVAVVQRMAAALEKPLGTHPVFNAQAMFENTGKHILIGPVDAEKFQVLADIAAAHAGSRENLEKRPLFTTLTCPTDPFRLEKNCADLIIESALLEGGGFVSSPVPLLAMSTPASLSGTLVIVWTDILAGLILGQLTRPGTRTFVSNSGTMMDLRFMGSDYGAPEMAMISAGITQISRYFNLPSHGSGFHSDCKTIDAQCGYESAMNGVITAMSGLNIINGLGAIELGFTFDYAKFMMDIDMVNNIKVLLNGVDMSEDEIALDMIKAQGPGGEFLSSPHTLQRLRQLSNPSLFDRRNRKGWVKLEQQDIVDRAYAEAGKIISSHEPPEVSADVKGQVNEIIEKYLQERSE
ncbi:MAG: trimethylamine methyltransferase family protein [Desulfobacterales bacterium]|nr:trimethylamine methyltransferase family protein [Desulfobacterales bacterium]